jgi:ligand-binding sensor domain-containing protein
LRNIRLKYHFSIIIVLLSFLLALISCDKEVFTGEPETIESRTSSIYVTSEPEGSSIYLDNRITGFVTPDTLHYVTPGEHGIILKRNLYVDTMLVVNVEAENMLSLFVNMNSNNLNFGSIIVNSAPTGASIYLNDMNTDLVTPDTLKDLIPGVYKILCAKENHRSDSTNLLLSAQEKASVFLTLRDTTEWVDYTMNSAGLPTNAFTDIVVYRNSIWFATKDKGLLQFNGTDWFNYPLDEYNLLSTSINKLYPDKNGNLWLCINGYLIRFNNGYKEFITHKIIGQDFKDMVIDSQGVFWLATRTGVVKYDGNFWEYIDSNGNNLDLTYANVLCFDSNEQLYIGTARHTNTSGHLNGGTFVKYSNNHFDIIHAASSNYYYGARTYTSITPDESGTIWVSYLEGVWGADSRFSFVNSSDSLEVYPWTQMISNNVNSYQVNDAYSYGGNILIAMEAGVIDFDQTGTSVYYNHNNSALPYAGITTVARDMNGAIWVGTTNNGVYKYKK